MNTPAHGIFNLLVLSRRGEANGVVPVALGAVLPDLPMVVFYAWVRLRAVPEGTIWGIHYYDAGWQAAFDGFHSLPLLALGVVWWRCRGWMPRIAILGGSYLAFLVFAAMVWG